MYANISFHFPNHPNSYELPKDHQGPPVFHGLFFGETFSLGVHCRYSRNANKKAEEIVAVETNIHYNKRIQVLSQFANIEFIKKIFISKDYFCIKECFYAFLAQSHHLEFKYEKN